MNQPSGDECVYKYSGGMATYCANHIPLAWYAPEVKKTFFVYGGTTKDSFTKLVHMVSCYDHETGMVPRPTILLDKKTPDAHDNPVINLDDRGYVWVFSSSHGRGRPSSISRSKKPYNVDEFEIAWRGNFSYPQPRYLTGQGFVFLHTFYNPERTICMMTSQDQGKSWKMVRQMTAGSEYNHSFVRWPVNAHPDFYGYWADGNGRKPSDSRLYFCNQKGDVSRMPVQMTEDFAKPEKR